MSGLLASPIAAETSREEHLRQLVEQVGHLLPSQAPIRRFVHHNTLHHFEDLPFEQAVVQGARAFGCEPFPKEEFFAKEFSRGRILERDLEAVLKEDSRRRATLDPNLPIDGWTRSKFRAFRLAQMVVWPSPEEIRFQVEEGEALRTFRPEAEDKARESFLSGQQDAPSALRRLWEALLENTEPLTVSESTVEGQIEQSVHSLLIRFCGAYLDQGISYWPMPIRTGLLATFRSLYSQPSVASSPWLSGLAGSLRAQESRGLSAEESLVESLLSLGASPQHWREALEHRGLALRGWAGMIHQLELHPELAPIQAPPVRLVDYFAIYLMLEIQARRFFQAPLGHTDRLVSRPPFELVYEAFVLAQIAGLGPAKLDDSSKVESWLREVRDFEHFERRRLLLQAYERRYRLEILDGIKHHSQMGEYRPCEEPKFQAVFCIDDREESLRRHLEEIEPAAQTLGMAGFFGVRMLYQGWNDTHSLPLCPATASPAHLIRELPLEQGKSQGRALGQIQQGLRAARNGVISGGLLATTAGFLAGFSLLGRTLVPGLFHRAAHGFEDRVTGAPLTRLKIEREEGESPNQDGLWEGFTVAEMAQIVKGALQMMGSLRLAKLFLLVGHGSSSLNNPHEAAHDCGATGGGRGGPNARAFAAMANHPEVRRVLSEEGLVIPDGTWFVGGYHNTCDDSMEYFDLDLVPPPLKEDLALMLEALERACVMDAHERCRRFHNVALSVSPAQAYRHVQERAVTLAQPRPEYGHCTNSICIVGRRERTRGLYLDRRAFLVSYDPTLDPDGGILKAVLESVGPVGAGINLEYYFSSIDCAGYGCGTKLPHNITGLLGVMDGHASDLRTGLPWQMVEIHEPMRMLTIVEAHPELLEHLLGLSAGLRGLVKGGWIQLVAWSPDSSELWTFQDGAFLPHQPDSIELPVVSHSRDYYGGHRGHLPPARIQSAFGGGR